ncbi:Uncharacterized protein Fot_18535 [Forsythia ovata]|uniref:Uncharacterized protein n=1 Tax=Forsythia ovata TaxID=205694 RepID=A0ABD1VIG4_9LAMI
MRSNQLLMMILKGKKFKKLKKLFKFMITLNEHTLQELVLGPFRDSATSHYPNKLGASAISHYTSFMERGINMIFVLGGNGTHAGPMQYMKSALADRRFPSIQAKELPYLQYPVHTITEQAMKINLAIVWLRAAVLGANDGLLSTSALMIGVGAVRKDIKTMILTGIAGLVAGACSMAIGEFVSVYSQYDIEVAQFKRENRAKSVEKSEMDQAEKEKLPNPFQAAAASAFAFAVGALVPLLAAAFISDYHVRLGVVVAAVSVALLGFGGVGSILGRAPLVKSSLRVLFGGWLAMGITFGLTKLIGSTGL